MRMIINCYQQQEVQQREGQQREVQQREGGSRKLRSKKPGFKSALFALMVAADQTVPFTHCFHTPHTVLWYHRVATKGIIVRYRSLAPLSWIRVSLFRD